MPPLDDIALRVMAAMAYITLSPDQRLEVESNRFTSLYILQHPWRRQ